MPGAGDYREAALRSARLGEDVERLAAAVAAWRVGDHVNGPAEGALTELLAWAAADMRLAADELARIARVCGDRATATWP